MCTYTCVHLNGVTAGAEVYREINLYGDQHLLEVLETPRLALAQ